MAVAIKTGESGALSAEALAAIDREVQKYPKGKQASAVMSALRIAQKEKGWLSAETIEYVAEYLDIPAIRALEVATFYNMYNLKPVGRRIKCVICRVRGRNGGGIEVGIGHRFRRDNGGRRMDAKRRRMLRRLQRRPINNRKQRNNARKNNRG